jgi:hypothetical protein
MTQAKGTEGFPALLREMMWRANFSYESKYFLYSVEIGHRLVETHACVLLHPCIMEGPLERSHHFFLVLEVLLKVLSKSAPTMLLSIFAADILSLIVLILLHVSHSMSNLAQMQCFIHILKMRMIFATLECLSSTEL